MLKRVPWTLLLVLSWAGARYSGVNLEVTGGAFLGFVALAFITIMLEFNRSGDIMLPSFKREQVLILMATLLLGSATPLVYQNPHIVDLIVIAVVLADGYVSPVNSFRTALRNMQAGVDTTAADA
jgi:hypothetical protein